MPRGIKSRALRILLHFRNNWIRVKHIRQAPRHVTLESESAVEIQLPGGSGSAPQVEILLGSRWGRSQVKTWLGLDRLMFLPKGKCPNEDVCGLVLEVVVVEDRVWRTVGGLF